MGEEGREVIPQIPTGAGETAADQEDARHHRALGDIANESALEALIAGLDWETFVSIEKVGRDGKKDAAFILQAIFDNAVLALASDLKRRGISFKPTHARALARYIDAKKIVSGFNLEKAPSLQEHIDTLCVLVALLAKPEYGINHHFYTAAVRAVFNGALDRELVVMELVRENHLLTQKIADMPNISLHAAQNLHHMIDQAFHDTSALIESFIRLGTDAPYFIHCVRGNAAQHREKYSKPMLGKLFSEIGELWGPFAEKHRRAIATVLPGKRSYDSGKALIAALMENPKTS